MNSRTSKPGRVVNSYVTRARPSFWTARHVGWYTLKLLPQRSIKLSVWDISMTRRVASSRSKIRLAQPCYLCVRNKPSPM